MRMLLCLLSERLREEYADRMKGMEAQLSCVDVRGMGDLRSRLEAQHKQEMEHLGEQHRLSMGQYWDHSQITQRRIEHIIFVNLEERKTLQYSQKFNEVFISLDDLY